MNRFLTTFFLATALVTSAFAAGSTFPGDVHVKGNLSLEAALTAPTPTATAIADDDGVLTGTLTRYYRISGHTARDERIISPTYQTITHAFGAGEDAVQVDWTRIAGVENYIVEYSADAVTWDNYVLVAVGTLTFIDTGAISWINATVASAYPTEVDGGDILMVTGSALKGGSVWVQNILLGHTNSYPFDNYGYISGKSDLPSRDEAGDVQYVEIGVVDFDTGNPTEILQLSNGLVTVIGDIVPANFNSYLGSAARPWERIYLEGGANGIYSDGTIFLSKASTASKMSIHTNLNVEGTTTSTRYGFKEVLASGDNTSETNSVWIGIASSRDLLNLASPESRLKIAADTETLATIDGQVRLNFIYPATGTWANGTPGTIHVYAYNNKWTQFAHVYRGEFPLSGEGDQELFRDPSIDVPTADIGLGNTYWFAYVDIDGDRQFNGYGLNFATDQSGWTQDPAAYGEHMPLLITDLEDGYEVNFYLADDRRKVFRFGWPETWDAYVTPEVYDKNAGNSLIWSLESELNPNSKTWFADWDYFAGSDNPASGASAGPSGATLIAGNYSYQFYHGTARNTAPTLTDIAGPQVTLTTLAAWDDVTATMTLDSPITGNYPIFLDYPQIEFKMSGNGNEAWPGLEIVVQDNAAPGVDLYHFIGPSQTRREDGSTYHLMSPHRTSTTLFNSSVITQDPPTSLAAGTVLRWRARWFRGAVEQYSAWDGWSTFTVTEDTPDAPPDTDRYPLDAATGLPVNPLFVWPATEDAVLYQVFFGTAPGVLTAQGYLNAATTTWSPAAPLALNTTYYWEVQAFNGVTTTANTEWSFTTTAVDGGVEGSFGDINISGDLDVTGETLLRGETIVSNNLIVATNLTVTWAATVGTTLGVTGVTTLTGGANLNGQMTAYADIVLGEEGMGESYELVFDDDQGLYAIYSIDKGATSSLVFSNAVGAATFEFDGPLEVQGSPWVQIMDGSNDPTTFTPRWIGDELMDYDQVSNTVWKAFGPTTNDWIVIFNTAL